MIGAEENFTEIIVYFLVDLFGWLFSIILEMVSFINPF